MIMSMSKEFGVPLTDQDMEQLKSSTKLKETNLHPHDQIEKGELVNYESMNEDYSYAHSDQKIPHTSRLWTPIDNFNDQFMQQKREQESNVKDFINENSKMIKELADKNRHKRPVKNYMIAEGPFHYSSQTLNSTELALNKFRDFINQVRSSIRYFLLIRI
jgi:hypothetical protein